MNLAQLAESLPNGLHDAELLRCTVDYVARTAVLDLEIWIAAEASPRELYRPARITLKNLDYFVIERPDPTYPARVSGPVTIDLSVSDKPLLANCEEGSAFRLFVSEWNAFVHAAASEAHLEWNGPAYNRGG